MIVRKLRAKRSWSQEQLADFAGHNVRTIQRVESGQKASVETLKSIASVFEVDISKLTEEITVIDKSSQKWKKLPWLYRVNMLGTLTRRQAITGELCLLGFALIYWAFDINTDNTPILFMLAYLSGWLVRFGDDKGSGILYLVIDSFVLQPQLGQGRVSQVFDSYPGRIRRIVVERNLTDVVVPWRAGNRLLFQVKNEFRLCAEFLNLSEVLSCGNTAGK